MSLIKWSPYYLFDPFEDFENIFAGFPSLANRAIDGFIPAVDVYQSEDDVIVEIPLAGVDPEKVDISIKNNILNVKGESEQKTEVEDKNYVRKEVRRGSFQRTIPLPVDVDGDKTSAVSENGMLKIAIPKKNSKIEEKKINIKIKK